MSITSATEVPPADGDRTRRWRRQLEFQSFYVSVFLVVFAGLVDPFGVGFYALGYAVVPLVAAAWAIHQVVFGRNTNFIVAAAKIFVPMSLTIVFITALLAERNWLAVNGLKPHQHLHGFHAVGYTGWYYAWNVADGIPGLKLPDGTIVVTFTGARAGMLLLVYKLVVLVPVLYCFHRAWKAHESRRDGEGLPAAPKIEGESE